MLLPTKNVFMIGGAEKLCAVKHSNGTDVSLSVHESGTNGFNAFFFSSTGVTAVPVHSNTGLADGGIVGQMKVSPTGTEFAVDFLMLLKQYRFAILILLPELLPMDLPSLP